MDVLSDEKWARWDSCDDNFAKYAHVKSNLIYGHLPAEKPDVSIMIPTFHRADTLKEALDSALAQKTSCTYTVNVLDNYADGDKATDELMKAYCEKYPNVLYYRHEQNLGVFGNWNRCIELAQADWLCMLHDDDMMKENYIEKVYSKATGTSYGIVGSYKTNFDNRKNKEWDMGGTGRSGVVSFFIDLFVKARNGAGIPVTNKDAKMLIYPPCMCHLGNKAKLLSSGGYDEDYGPAADCVFYEKIMKYYGFLFIPEPLFYYRIEKNLSLENGIALKGLYTFAALAKAIQKSLGKPEKKCSRVYNEGVVIAYNSVFGGKYTMDFSDVADQTGIPAKYKKLWLRKWIMLKYYFAWGKLLFRKA